MSSPKVEFIQPAYAKYREPLFKRLMSSYDVQFHFLNEISPGKAKSLPDWIPSTEYGHLSNMKKYSKLLSNIYSSNADAIITSISFSPHSVLFAVLRQISILDTPLILWSEEWRPPVRNNVKDVSVKRFFLNRPKISKFVCRNVDSILLPHKEFFDYWNTLGADPENVFYVSQCSKDYSQENHEDLSNEIGLENETILLYLGNIIERKGLDILIKSVARLEQDEEDICLLVVGDGPFRSACEELAEEKSVSSVKFTGRVPEEKIASYYELSDVFILPSVLREHYEPCPISVLEAMSMRNPVIVTDAVGSAGWNVRNGYNGYVVSEQDSDELHQALRELVKNPKKRKKFGNRSRELFENYSNFDRMFSGFSDGINNAIKRAEHS